LQRDEVDSPPLDVPDDEIVVDDVPGGRHIRSSRVTSGK
jgi:hypothetical protein